jgi:hypothetical protein
VKAPRARILEFKQIIERIDSILAFLERISLEI